MRLFVAFSFQREQGCHGGVIVFLFMFGWCVLIQALSGFGSGGSR
jgi:hypothetical protein